MKKTRFTETQIVAILKETDAGMKVADICRKHGHRGPHHVTFRVSGPRL